MFSQASVILFTRGGACVAGACMVEGHGGGAGGVHGRGHAWRRGYVWQGGMCGRGYAWQGACMAGGGGHAAWQERRHCSRWYTSYWNALLLPAATKLGQGNIFTPVCHSVNGGYLVWSLGGVPGLVLGGCTWQTPQDQVHPPGTRYIPGPGTTRTRHPLGPGTPSGPGTPPPEYGKRTAGTHPTGMHSCFHYFSEKWTCHRLSVPWHFRSWGKEPGYGGLIVQWTLLLQDHTQWLTEV